MGQGAGGASLWLKLGGGSACVRRIRWVRRRRMVRGRGWRRGRLVRRIFGWVVRGEISGGGGMNLEYGMNVL